MPSRSILLTVAAAALLATAATDPKCAGSNVTLGTPADDPEVPHRAPSIPPRVTAWPTSTPLPPITSTPLPAAIAAPPLAPTLVPPPAAMAAPPPGDSVRQSPVEPPRVRPAPEGTVEPPPATAAGPLASPLERSLGDAVTLAAPACASKGSHIRAGVPRSEDLDVSYRGAVPGIEIRRTVRAGTAGYRNAKLAGGTLEVDLWARGSGLVAGAVGYETCTGGAPADVSFEVVAHYRR